MPQYDFDDDQETQGAKDTIDGIPKGKFHTCTS